MHRSSSTESDRAAWEQLLGLPGRKGHSRRDMMRRLLTVVKREAFVSFSHAVVITASALLVLTTLNALHASNENASEESLASLWNEGAQLHAMNETHTQLSQELHDSFDIPFRLLDPMTFESKLALLDELRKPPKNVEMDYTRRVVFGHIHGHTLVDRIRALATVVSYAQGTGRVPVIFWHLYHDGFKSPFSSLLDWNCLTDYQFVTVIDILDVFVVEPKGKKLSASRQISEDPLPDTTLPQPKELLDWAELSMHEIQPDLGATEVSYTAQYLNRKYPDGTRSRPFLHKSADDDFPSTVTALDAVASWNTHVELTLSTGVRSRYSPLVAAEEAVQTCLVPKSPLALVSIANAHMAVLKRATPNRTNVVRMLHDEFQIPYLLLNGLRPVMQRLLLDKLLRKKKQGQYAPRTMWIHPQYGLGNRLRALGSAMAFARETGRIIVVIWMPDVHLNCYFRDLFVEHDEVLVSDTFDPEEQWPFVVAKTRDVAMHAVDWYNFMRINGVHVSKPSDPVLDAPAKHIYVSTAYVLQSPETPFIIKTESLYWRILRSLTPHIDVARLVNRHDAAFVRSVMGIHIRAKSIRTDIPGVGSELYSAESSRRTDYWRSLTRVDSFVEEMQKQNSSQVFYVAADQNNALMRIDREFPGRVIFTPRRCDSRSKDCLPFALADILLLAKCSTIRGSYWSSFSELSVRWSGVKFLLAGVNFGRPSGNFTQR